MIQKHVKMPNFIIVGAPLYHSFAKRSSLIYKKCVFGDHLFFFAFCSLMMKGSWIKRISTQATIESEIM